MSGATCRRRTPSEPGLQQHQLAAAPGGANAPPTSGGFGPTAEALLVYAEKRVRARLAEYERTRKTDRTSR